MPNALDIPGCIAGRTYIRLRDDFDERDATPVEVEKRAVGLLVVKRLSRIFLHMDSRDAYAAWFIRIIFRIEVDVSA